jgi:hypothetical protein
MYHFGCGANLQIDFLKTLLPSAKFVMKGYLLNHENTKGRKHEKGKKNFVFSIFRAFVIN